MSSSLTIKRRMSFRFPGAFRTCREIFTSYSSWNNGSIISYVGLIRSINVGRLIWLTYHASRMGNIGTSHRPLSGLQGAGRIIHEHPRKPSEGKNRPDNGQQTSTNKVSWFQTYQHAAVWPWCAATSSRQYRGSWGKLIHELHNYIHGSLSISGRSTTKHGGSTDRRRQQQL